MKVQSFIKVAVCLFVLLILQAMPFLWLAMFNFLLWGILSLAYYVSCRMLVMFSIACGIITDILSHTTGVWVLIYLIFSLSFKRVIFYFEIKPRQAVFFLWGWVFLYVLTLYFFLNNIGFGVGNFLLVFVENIVMASLIFYIIQKCIVL